MVEWLGRTTFSFRDWCISSISSVAGTVCFLWTSGLIRLRDIERCGHKDSQAAGHWPFPLLQWWWILPSPSSPGSCCQAWLSMWWAQVWCDLCDGLRCDVIYVMGSGVTSGTIAAFLRSWGEASMSHFFCQSTKKNSRFKSCCIQLGTALPWLTCYNDSNNSNSGLPKWLSGKNPPATSGDAGLIPGSGRFPGGGNGNPFQYSCLENSMNRRAWQAAVWGVTKIYDWVTSMHNSNCYCYSWQ